MAWQVDLQVILCTCLTTDDELATLPNEFQRESSGAARSRFALV